jgi:hypothetical protein
MHEDFCLNTALLHKNVENKFKTLRIYSLLVLCKIKNAYLQNHPL